jgi:DNA-binding CsgD family transcriptional regulator
MLGQPGRDQDGITEGLRDRGCAVELASSWIRAAVAEGSGRESSPRPAAGWTDLTDAEQNVASLVADGLTNRQIGARLYVSPYTVDAHLRHIFTKLAISSRVQLAALAVRAGVAVS